MINRTIVNIIKSLDNLPKEYKFALMRILAGILDAIATLDEIKVDKEDGKGLSSNDFTDELKDKLDNIEPGATVQVPSDWNATEGVTRILNKPDLTIYPDSAEWNKNDKKIYFKNGNNVLTPFTIDATDFVIDGMVDDVKIENGKLVIIFNTESGKERIELDLTDIFDPNNYYNKTEIDNLIKNTSSDWNENDENKASYIKNRTHWKTIDYNYNRAQFSNSEETISVARLVEIMNIRVPATLPGQEIKLWEYNEDDKQAISFKKENDGGIRLMLYTKYPNIQDGVINLYYGPTDYLDDVIYNILFDSTRTKYNINNNLDTLYPGIRTYNFEDKGFKTVTYHKLDKNYLPDDIGVEGITDEEIDELIAD